MLNKLNEITMNSLQNYLDEPKGLFDLLLLVTEVDRLLLNPPEWLESIHPWKWQKLARKSHSTMMSFYVSEDHRYLMFYEGETRAIYSAPLGDYRSCIERVYEHVYCRLYLSEPKPL